MAALVHFVKTDATVRTSTNTTAEELTNYTITWSTLTTAGFAAGDDVLIMVAVKTWNSSANGNTFFAVGFGTTFAGRAEATSSLARAEPFSNTNGDQYGPWINRRILVTNENIYFRGNTAAAGTASYDEFVCMILKLTGLSSNDFIYAEATASGNAPNTATDGASTTIPMTGDWLLIGCGHWLVDSTTLKMVVRLDWGAANLGIQTGGADTSDERVFGPIAYVADLAATTTVKITYNNTSTAVNDLTDSMIFGLRLDIFENHDGTNIVSTIAHSAVDTYQEFAGFPTYGLTTTGPFIVMGLPRHALDDVTRRPYGRIQIGGSDWPAVDANRTAVADNEASAFIGPLLFGYNASQSAATLDIDLDVAEDADATPPYNCDVQIAAAFSLMLAAIGPTTGLLTPPISAAMMSMLVR